MKARFLSLLAVVLCLVSCQRDADDLNVAMGGEQEVMLTVSLPETTRATDSALGFNLQTLGTTYDLRYILEIYRVDANGVVLYDNCQRFVETSDSNTMVFPVRLAPGYNYRIVAWADIVDEGSKADRYYYTEEGLDNVVIKDNGTVNWNAMDETRDAYTAVKVVDDFSSASDLDMELTRPFAKVRVVATDITDIRKVGLEPTTAIVEYSQDMYYKYNAVADVENKGVAEDAKAKSHNISYPATPVYEDATGEMTLFADYIFVPSTGTAKFTLTVNAAAGVIKENNFNTEIFVERNKLTTIKGDVLTTGGNVKVTVDNGLGVKETYTYVDTAEDLQDKINNATDNKETNISLGGNIDLSDLLSIGTLSTRAAATLPIVIPDNKSIVLDLNGFTITTPWEDESAEKHYYAFENHGTLTIKDSSENGNGKIIARGNFNYGRMTLESGTIDACDGNGGYGVRNYEGAEFVMNGGSIVTSNEDGDAPGSGYDACPVRVNEGAIATFNGGTINNISNFTFAIDNYGETTINGGTFTTIHTTITNSATMTINGGSFTCNGLEGITAHAFWAAAGTTTINGGTFDGKDNYNGFNVDASEGATVNINGGKFLRAHSGSLYGKGTITVKGGEFFDDPSARVADGYKAEEANGVWTIVFDPAAKIGNEEYATLQEAFNVGGEITLLRNVTVAESVVLPEGKTAVLDLNGFVINGAEESTVKHIYAMKNYGTLTIKDAKSNGSINSRGIYNYGTLNLNSGKISALDGNGGYAVNNQSGSIFVMNGGWIAADYEDGDAPTSGNFDATALNVPAGATATLNGGKITNAGNFTFAVSAAGTLTVPVESTLVISGRHGAISVGGGETTINAGTYSIPENTESTDNVVYVYGGKMTINAGTFIGDHDIPNGGCCVYDANGGVTINGGVFGNSSGGDVWGTTGTTIKGGTFENLIEKQHIAEGYKAVEANGVWTVVVDPAAKIGETEYATLQEAFNVGGEITLLRDITVAEPVVLAEGKTAVLDLNGKTLAAADEQSTYAINNHGNLTIKGNGTVNARGMYNGYNADGNYVTTAKLTIENGTFNAKGTNGGACVFNYGNVDINGGTFTSIGGYSLNNQASGSMNIYSATVTGGIYNVGVSLVVNDGNIQTIRAGYTHAIYHDGTSLVINGGTFMGNGNEVVNANSAVATINGGTFTKDPNGKTSYLMAGANMTINNGTFNAHASNPAGHPVRPDVIVKGGTFNYKHSNIAAGYKIVDNGNGTWTVVAE